MGTQFTSSVYKISAADITPKSLNKVAHSTPAEGKCGRGLADQRHCFLILSTPSTILERSEPFATDSGLEV